MTKPTKPRNGSAAAAPLGATGAASWAPVSGAAGEGWRAAGRRRLNIAAPGPSLRRGPGLAASRGCTACPAALPSWRPRRRPWRREASARARGGVGAARGRWAGLRGRPRGSSVQQGPWSGKMEAARGPGAPGYCFPPRGPRRERRSPATPASPPGLAPAPRPAMRTLGLGSLPPSGAGRRGGRFREASEREAFGRCGAPKSAGSTRGQTKARDAE